MVQQGLFCDVEWYLKSKNLAFRLLHIFSIAPTQLQALGLVNPSLPMNSTLLLSLAIIVTFKSSYTHHTFCTILDARKDDTFFSISEL
jgi:hypothetical protein